MVQIVKSRVQKTIGISKQFQNILSYDLFLLDPVVFFSHMFACVHVCLCVCVCRGKSQENDEKMEGKDVNYEKQTGDEAKPFLPPTRENIKGLGKNIGTETKKEKEKEKETKTKPQPAAPLLTPAVVSVPIVPVSGAVVAPPPVENNEKCVENLEMLHAIGVSPLCPGFKQAVAFLKSTVVSCSTQSHNMYFLFVAVFRKKSVKQTPAICLFSIHWMTVTGNAISNPTT